jgi:hypothetical protein
VWRAPVNQPITSVQSVSNRTRTNQSQGDPRKRFIRLSLTSCKTTKSGAKGNGQASIRVHQRARERDSGEVEVGRSITSDFSVDDIKCINYYRFRRFTFETERYTCSGGGSRGRKELQGVRETDGDGKRVEEKREGQDGHIGTKILKTTRATNRSTGRRQMVGLQRRGTNYATGIRIRVML